ncbi:viperin family antiviral radical SAM protein [Photobacterium kishitanii]|uniref:S-adenosylmethionine-dependent nucleotide dehydratase n=1 Tax=Photobacterium kishitanii TaxID=318456 RepID=A0A2T3KLB4_9GAMM|nr:viperin family antiviral radical SAM protein [Photobacterium kishitanii]PSV00437.1 radical SAM protein [Photobacterium kishitanii]
MSNDSKELVINWHLTEKCNFKCNYCFSKYSDNKLSHEIHRNKEQYTHLLELVFNYFTAKYKRPLRLSLAGGEPLISSNIVDIADTAKRLGFRVSLITNGFNLTKKIATDFCGKLDMIGVSVDSESEDIDIAIGRCTNGKKTLNQNSLLLSLGILRNSGATIKLNTVVNKLNVHSTMSDLVSLIRPDKWKILQVLPINDTDVVVTDSEFSNFIERHDGFSSIITQENNELMTHSYIMIDPKGRFFQNGDACAGYSYSDGILAKNDVGACFSQLDFDMSKFSLRY